VSIDGSPRLQHADAEAPAPATDRPTPARRAAANLETIVGQPRKPRSTASRVLDRVGPFLVFGLFIAFWYFMAFVGIEKILGKPKFFIPPPHDVVQDAFFNWDNLQPMLEALWLSTKVALVGLLIAIVIGMALAILMSQAKWVERSTYPYAVALQCLPILAFVPLLGLLFGYGINTRVVVCVMIALFPIIASTLFGLLSVDRSHHELFSLQHAGRATRLWKLQLPAAMPSIFNGFRTSAGLAVIGAIVGDLFFQQGEKGIGILIQSYTFRLQYRQMYGAVILASLLGIVVFWAFGILRHLVVGRWYEDTRQGD
jgi:NitT/TauT family transport system permease protein